MNKTSDAQKRASAKHQSKLDAITLRPPKETGERIRAAASAAGVSLQRYILDAVTQRIEREAKPGRMSTDELLKLLER